LDLEDEVEDEVERERCLELRGLVSGSRWCGRCDGMGAESDDANGDEVHVVEVGLVRGDESLCDEPRGDAILSSCVVKFLSERLDTSRGLAPEVGDKSGELPLLVPCDGLVGWLLPPPPLPLLPLLPPLEGGEDESTAADESDSGGTTSRCVAAIEGDVGEPEALLQPLPQLLLPPSRSRSSSSAHSATTSALSMSDAVWSSTMNESLLCSSAMCERMASVDSMTGAEAEAELEADTEPLALLLMAPGDDLVVVVVLGGTAASSTPCEAGGAEIVRTMAADTPSPRPVEVLALAPALDRWLWWLLLGL